MITGVGDRDKFTLTSDMIKENAIVIDVATTHHDGKLKGDSDFDEIISKHHMHHLFQVVSVQ